MENDFNQIKNNVLTLVNKTEKGKEETGILKVSFNDTLSTDELIEATHFGAYNDIPGFLVFWKEGEGEATDEIVGFYNTAVIKSIKLLKRNNDISQDN